MILTGKKIKEEISKGQITIEPFYENCIQPNSYDFHLGQEIIRYSDGIINNIGRSNLPIVMGREKGFKIIPGEFYLGITEEKIASEHYSQLLFGDHSIGSLGIWVQISAPLAHVGSKIRWTLEIRTVKEAIIYPGMKFGKICFLENFGEIDCYGCDVFSDSGRYLNNEITPSLITKRTVL